APAVTPGVPAEAAAPPAAGAVVDVPYLSDHEVVERASCDPAFAALWRGDCSAHARPGNEGRSEADWAMARELAYWAGPDPARVASIMRRSGLARDKWDRPYPG